MKLITYIAHVIALSNLLIVTNSRTFPTNAGINELVIEKNKLKRSKIINGLLAFMK